MKCIPYVISGTINNCNCSSLDHSLCPSSSSHESSIEGGAARGSSEIPSSPNTVRPVEQLILAFSRRSASSSDALYGYISGLSHSIALSDAMLRKKQRSSRVVGQGHPPKGSLISLFLPQPMRVKRRRACMEPQVNCCRSAGPFRRDSSQSRFLIRKISTSFRRKR